MCLLWGALAGPAVASPAVLGRMNMQVRMRGASKSRSGRTSVVLVYGIGYLHSLPCQIVVVRLARTSGQVCSLGETFPCEHGLSYNCSR
ncbi:hypothetical protein BDP81DRAFT_415421 [Colletotrichum phormii]|uniref:Uncharacterized protein n=1 Tax=Colletotrichum phormii TaxID=359342 RepID=A0AAJ0A3F3_9PEZI|nr:uncharacterized protein BDP81DRAFT_415421 [Colletotrichum phormii]KAK1654307.1 hypothetical protein BDP81DRAFT_415421 [Colletotrichum phormii]